METLQPKSMIYWGSSSIKAIWESMLLNLLSKVDHSSISSDKSSWAISMLKHSSNTLFRNRMMLMLMILMTIISKNSNQSTLKRSTLKYKES